MTILTAGIAVADPCEAPLPAEGTVFAGRVTTIIDGDGLCVGAAEGGIEVRLADFDAPEPGGAGGATATAALTRLALGRKVACLAGPRSLDRTIARCEVAGMPLGTLLRASGVPEGGRAVVPTIRRPTAEDRLAAWIRLEPRRLRTAALALVHTTMSVLVRREPEGTPTVQTALVPDR